LILPFVSPSLFHCILSMTPLFFGPHAVVVSSPIAGPLFVLPPQSRIGRAADFRRDVPPSLPFFSTTLVITRCRFPFSPHETWRPRPRENMSSAGATVRPGLAIFPPSSLSRAETMERHFQPSAVGEYLMTLATEFSAYF